jgi:predicted TIM-barrel fold metal-dependent hydrolase
MTRKLKVRKLCIKKDAIFFMYLLIAMMLVTGCDVVGGAFDHDPEDLQKSISPEAQNLIDQAYKGLDPTQLRDYHTHLVGMNTQVYGTYVNERWQSMLSGCLQFFQFQIYKSAAGITDEEQADAQYISRLRALIQHLPNPGKFGLMAFDYFHNEVGEAKPLRSTFHVPNDRMMDLVHANPEIFFPIISIHPYRDDAADRLRHYAEKGVRFVKWLPNAMGIHPASESMRGKVESYYRVMHEYNMVLISHTGDEKATEAEEFQHLGNPLFLKKPLDMGVTVVMAHVASLGACLEEDASICTPGIPYIDLAIGLLEEPKYKDLLFADISALTQFNRKHNLDAVLANSSIHSNLINGSDYPLPAVNFVIQTRALVKSGHITSEEREALNEIYDYNPLLFDFVLKRTLHHSEYPKVKFPSSVFLEHPSLLTD